MKVSVVVPIYNVSQYVNDTLDSLINQTYKNIEIIAVDDGSTDDSGAICDRLSQTDDRVTVIHKPNGGLSDARNAGIKVATGDYIMLLDGDDRLVIDAIERLVAICCEENDVDLIQFTYSEVDANGEPLYPYTYSQSKEIVTDEKEKYNRLYALGGPAASACTKLYKRELFENLQFCKGIIHEDEYIVTDILSRANKVLYFDAALYLYYFRNGSIITSSFTPKRMDIFTVLDKRMEVLNKKGYEDLLRKEQKRVFETILRFYFDAKDFGYSREAFEIKSRLNGIPYEANSVMTGKQKLIFIVCKRFNAFIDIIYLLRKLLKRTDK